MLCSEIHEILNKKKKMWIYTYLCNNNNNHIEIQSIFSSEFLRHVLFLSIVRVNRIETFPSFIPSRSYALGQYDMSAVRRVAFKCTYFPLSNN